MSKKLLSLALALIMSLSLCIPAFATEAEATEKIIHLSTNSIVTNVPVIVPNANDPTNYTYTFSNVKCTTQHVEKVVAGPATNTKYPSENTWPKLSYAKGISTNFSGSISGQMALPLAVIKANISANAGISNTVTNTETIDYYVPYRYKASIICYLDRQYYTFHCVTKNLVGVTISETDGYCTGGVYDHGYDVRLVRV